MNYPALGTLNVYTGKVQFTSPITQSRRCRRGAMKMTGKVHLSNVQRQALLYAAGSSRSAVEATIVGGGGECCQLPTAITDVDKPTRSCIARR